MPRKSRQVIGLTEVAGAIATGDFPAALAGALAAWRATRCTEFADLVEAIAKRCREVTIAGRSAKAFQKAWMQLAESKPAPVAIGALAADIAKSIPVPHIGTYAPDRDIRRYRAFLDRVAALAKLPHDPRVASAILDVLERAPFTIESGRRIYQPAVDLVVKIADVRSPVRLRGIVERPTSKAALVRAYFAEALPPAADAIAGRGVATVADADRATAISLIAALATAAPGKRGAARDVDALIAEVLAHPDDDGPREVLADALLEREDPRGEFISLQLRAEAGALDDAQRKRVNALLRTHEREWLGDLAAVTKHRVWRRGFLEEAELARNASAEQSTWKRAANDPRLATVRRLDKGGGNSTHYSAFVLSPAMRGLRELTALSLSMLKEIRAGRRLDAIIVETPSLTDEGLELLAKAAERSGATRLGFAYNVRPDVLIARLAALPDRARIRELGARPIGGNAARWMTEPWLWLGAHATFGVPALALDFETLRVRAEATKQGLALDVHADGDWLLETILGKAPKIAAVILRGGHRASPLRPVVRTALAKLGGKLAAHDHWVALTTDRGRARRARRA